MSDLDFETARKMLLALPNEKAQAGVRVLAEVYELQSKLNHASALTVELQTEVRALQGKLSWRPIETAPQDGTEVLLIATIGSMLEPNPERIVGRYERGWWAEEPLGHVTHWMPLPEAPE